MLERLGLSYHADESERALEPQGATRRHCARTRPAPRRMPPGSRTGTSPRGAERDIPSPRRNARNDADAGHSATAVKAEIRPRGAAEMIASAAAVAALRLTRTAGRDGVHARVAIVDEHLGRAFSAPHADRGLGGRLGVVVLREGLRVRVSSYEPASSGSWLDMHGRGWADSATRATCSHPLRTTASQPGCRRAERTLRAARRPPGIRPAALGRQRLRRAERRAAARSRASRRRAGRGRRSRR